MDISITGSTLSHGADRQNKNGKSPKATLSNQITLVTLANTHFFDLITLLSNLPAERHMRLLRSFGKQAIRQLTDKSNKVIRL